MRGGDKCVCVYVGRRGRKSGEKVDEKYRGKRDPKTRKRLKRTLFNQTKRDRMPIFEEILFFKATYSTKTNKSPIF